MITERETGVEECVAQAWAFLAQSDAEFESGDTRQGAEKLYGAATQVVIAAAKQRGWDHRSHRANKNTVIRLYEEYGDTFIPAGFTAAEKFHVHFFHGNLEDYEIDADRPIVHRYVERMADLIEGYEVGEPSA